MIIVSYDFEDDKRRGRFSKFLKKFGRRIQYSVFELKNSQRVLNNVLAEIKSKYEPIFTKADSIVIINICEACRAKIKRFGYAANEEQEVVFFN
ncbi:MAG: CRISPR-associated endonuclease Cas2 [Candidatus Omnitrophica bacterium]|nr:CRISPR-associated endonuclease Cas2 [Candidatus Omnitrophota bacterium]